MGVLWVTRIATSRNSIVEMPISYYMCIVIRMNYEYVNVSPYNNSYSQYGSKVEQTKTTAKHSTQS
eukprot:822332-Amphidinium_carterae.1